MENEMPSLDQSNKLTPHTTMAATNNVRLKLCLITISLFE
jgi:hypothetical protein